MFPSLRRALVGAAALALSLSSFAVDIANAYPDRPIKIIVTFPPGGSADIVIRALRLSCRRRCARPSSSRTSLARTAMFARGFRKIHPKRKREVGQADRRGRDQSRINLIPIKEPAPSFRDHANER